MLRPFFALASLVSLFAGLAIANPISSATISATCVQNSGAFPPVGSPFGPNTVVDRDSLSGNLNAGPPKNLVASMCDGVDTPNNTGLGGAGFYRAAVSNLGVSAELLAEVVRNPGNNFYGMNYTAEAWLHSLIPLVVWGGSGNGVLLGRLSAVGDGDLNGRLSKAEIRLNGALVPLCGVCPPTAFQQAFTFGVPFLWTVDAALAFQGPGFGGYSVALFAEFAQIVDAQGRPIAGAHVEDAPEPAAWLMMAAGLVALGYRNRATSSRGRSASSGSLLL